MKANYEQPTITTVSIEVKVLRIGNKQMTLSVFDQLYEESPCDSYEDELYEIAHPIWGKVRRKDENFVIFEKNGELRKYKMWGREQVYSFEGAVYFTVTRQLDHYDSDFFFPDWKKLYDLKTHSRNLPDSFYYDSYGKANRVKWFLSQLTEEELTSMQDQFNKALSSTNAWNNFQDILSKSEQIFIAV